MGDISYICAYASKVYCKKYMLNQRRHCHILRNISLQLDIFTIKVLFSDNLLIYGAQTAYLNSFG